MILLPRPALCLVTDRRAVDPGARTLDAQLLALERQLDEAVEAGIDLIQLREGDLPARDLLGLAERVAARARQTATRVLVNDRADVALTIPDAGLHLKSAGPVVSTVRALAGTGRLIGRSAHDPIDLALAAGADFLIFGTVFPSASKPPGAVPAGVDALRQACTTAPMPVLAIGGVAPDRVAECRRAGAAGVAAIGLFLSPGRAPGAIGPRAAALALREAWLR
jgi:thiamine-phosphate pyrophosphorylase